MASLGFKAAFDRLWRRPRLISRWRHQTGIDQIPMRLKYRVRSFLRADLPAFQHPLAGLT